jgi:hypothetical protein
MPRGGGGQANGALWRLAPIWDLKIKILNFKSGCEIWRLKSEYPSESATLKALEFQVWR